MRVTGFKGLIYKPPAKFLPPANLDDDSADVLLSGGVPALDGVDSSSKRDSEAEK